jgi:hypothetical protein
LALLAAGLLVVVSAGPALAHGLGGRIDPRVPRWLFLYGAAAAVVISFVALVVLWKTPRLEGMQRGRPLPEAAQRVLRSRFAEMTVRAIALVMFLVVLASGLRGGTGVGSIAPVFVYIWFWVGLAFLHALLGNIWATLSPWDTLARLFGLGERPPRGYPKAAGIWPAAFLLLAFTWMELVDPFGSRPATIGAAIAVYSAITLTGMSVFGRQTWNEQGEAFAVYFGLLSRISPLVRDQQGRVVLRPVLGGLPALPVAPGLVPFVLVSLGSTTFDGLSRSGFWLTKVATRSRFEAAALGTVGLIGMVLAVSILYTAAMLAAAAVSGAGWRPLAVRFVHSLVPIAFAYLVAHYFSLLLLEGQQGIALASDPFGVGWNLFGTADWHINYGLLSAFAVWYIQVAAIVGGHVGGVILAHDRAIASFPPDRALRTQYALLAVMVLFTVGGLLILSGG